MLITLVIIGVISAITVPAIVQKTQKREYVSGLKKANAVLQQALYKIAENNGASQGDYEFLKKDVNFIDEFEKVSNVVKKCNTTAECYGSKYTVDYKHLDGSDAWDFSSGKSIITTDGQMFALATGVSGQGLSKEDTENTIARIAVDVNGYKKPNKSGLDVFLFYIVDGKGIVPAGAKSQACSRKTSGWTCAAKVLKENAINY